MRLRRLAALLVAPLFGMALIPAPQALADSGSPSVPFDAFIAGGDASCLEVSVGTGYSFIVEPDARLPRSTATISEGESGAVAAPADPGDSVDALAGLMIPREEQTIGGYIQEYFPPSVSSGLTQVENVVNPHLEYPYEHASAAYPDPKSTGPQEQTYLGAPNASFSDPSGALSVDGAVGDAKADALSASANSGAAAAASVPMLGIRVGRVAAHAIAQVTDTSVTDDASCTLHDVSVAPPGSGATLHIGSLIETLHTERLLSGGGATETHALQLADVTINGKNILPAGHGPITFPPGVPTSYHFPQPPQIPCGGLPAGTCMQPPALQSITLSGTASKDSRAASNNEITSTLTAATIVIKSTAPVPSTIPPVVCSGNPPNPNTCQNPLSTTPATYTVQLANLDSNAYGLPTQPFSASSAPGGAAGASTVGSVPGVSGLSGGYTGGHISSYAGSPPIPGKPGTEATSSLITIPGTPAALRWSVVGIAALMEALLLTSLFVRRRWLQGRRVRRALPTSFLDLP